MYSEQDGKIIRQRITKYSVIMGVGMAALLAAFIVGLNVRLKALVMVAGVALFVYACFMWVMLIYPCV